MKDEVIDSITVLDYIRCMVIFTALVGIVFLGICLRLTKEERNNKG